jgi:hypothetical protein
MLSATSKFAQKAAGELTSETQKMADSITGIIKNFDNQTSSLIDKGMQKIQEMIDSYTRTMSQFKFPNLLAPTSALGTIGTAVSAVTGAAGAVQSPEDSRNAAFHWWSCRIFLL